jgi:hypothetical protein
MYAAIYSARAAGGGKGACYSLRVNTTTATTGRIATESADQNHILHQRAPPLGCSHLAQATSEFAMQQDLLSLVLMLPLLPLPVCCLHVARFARPSQPFTPNAATDGGATCSRFEQAGQRPVGCDSVRGMTAAMPQGNEPSINLPPVVTTAPPARADRSPWHIGEGCTPLFAAVNPCTELYPTGRGQTARIVSTLRHRL